MRTVTIPTINHASQSTKGIEHRQIAVVHGVCMYQSTGNNSGLASTWFPFLGINNQNHPYFSRSHVEGFYFKPIYAFSASHEIEDGYPPEVYAKMNEIFQRQTRNMAARFGSSYNMMVSSQFGGGLWDTPEGQTFKKWLETSYPNFYQNFPKLQAEPGPEMTDGIKVNQWMRQQGGDFKKLPLKIKVFSAPVEASKIIGKPKRGAQEYIISWLKFVPEMAKKIIAELPPIKLPSFSMPSVSLPSITLPSIELPSVIKRTSKPLPDNIAKSVYAELESKHLSWAMYGSDRRELLEPAMKKLIKLSKNKKIDESTRKQEVIKILSEVCSKAKMNDSTGGEQAFRIANNARKKYFGHRTQAIQETRKSFILNPKILKGEKSTSDKEKTGSPAPHHDSSKKKRAGPN